LFSHIVDLENMYLIFDNVLSFDERNELFHRVGIMNVLDPMRPERLYRLDLRRNDHREWVKILVYLATNDPGGVWEEVEYRWGKYDEPVPGWTLPCKTISMILYCVVPLLYLLFNISSYLDES